LEEKTRFAQQKKEGNFSSSGKTRPPILTKEGKQQEPSREKKKELSCAKEEERWQIYLKRNAEYNEERRSVSGRGRANFSAVMREGG